MRKLRVWSVLAILALFVAPDTASAYVGPGGGLTVIGAALALIAGVVLGIFGFVWYPIKRLMRTVSKKPSAQPGDLDN